jgi:hypothetical protein
VGTFVPTCWAVYTDGGGTSMPSSKPCPLSLARHEREVRSDMSWPSRAEPSRAGHCDAATFNDLSWVADQVQAGSPMLTRWMVS